MARIAPIRHTIRPTDRAVFIRARLPAVFGASDAPSRSAPRSAWRASRRRLRRASWVVSQFESRLRAGSGPTGGARERALRARSRHRSGHRQSVPKGGYRAFPGDTCRPASPPSTGIEWPLAYSDARPPGSPARPPPTPAGPGKWRRSATAPKSHAGFSRKKVRIFVLAAHYDFVAAFLNLTPWASAFSAMNSTPAASSAESASLGDAAEAKPGGLRLVAA